MKLEVEDLSLAGVKLIRSNRFTDPRGYFAEVYVQPDFAAAGIGIAFVQDNQSRSHTVGTVRGLHFQTPPYAQAKLVRVLRGRIFDVALDLRRSSPTYGQHLGVALSAEGGEQLLVPHGFAHGFCTLEPETEVLYKVDRVYSQAHDRGVNWADPALGIRWPVADGAAILSDKDRTLPLLRELPFHFD